MKFDAQNFDEFTEVSYKKKRLEGQFWRITDHSSNLFLHYTVHP